MLIMFALIDSFLIVDEMCSFNIETESQLGYFNWYRVKNEIASVSGDEIDF